MARLVVRIIGTESARGAETILAVAESYGFSPDQLEAEVGLALGRAVEAVGGNTDAALREWQPEISVSLTGEDGEVRPSLHLSAALLARLAHAAASFDFDPYV